jgi:hypothetical protein
LYESLKQRLQHYEGFSMYEKNVCNISLTFVIHVIHTYNIKIEHKELHSTLSGKILTISRYCRKS